MCEREPKRERELLLHILTQARSDSDAYPRDVSGAVLSSSLWKNSLTGNPAAAVTKTNHLNSVTHPLRSAEAVTCLHTHQALSVYLWVKNHAVTFVPFNKKQTQPERFAMDPRDQRTGETTTNETSPLHL